MVNCNLGYTYFYLHCIVSPTIEPLKDIKVLEESSLKVLCNITHGFPSPDVFWFGTKIGEGQVIGRDHVLELKHIKVSQSGQYHCRAENYMGKTEQSMNIQVISKYLTKTLVDQCR